MSQTDIDVRIKVITTIKVANGSVAKSNLFLQIKVDGLWCCNQLPGNNVDFATSP